MTRPEGPESCGGVPRTPPRSRTPLEDFIDAHDFEDLEAACEGRDNDQSDVPKAGWVNRVRNIFSPGRSLEIPPPPVSAELLPPFPALPKPQPRQQQEHLPQRQQLDDADDDELPPLEDLTPRADGVRANPSGPAVTAVEDDDPLGLEQERRQQDHGQVQSKVQTSAFVIAGVRPGPSKELSRRELLGSSPNARFEAKQAERAKAYKSADASSAAPQLAERRRNADREARLNAARGQAGALRQGQIWSGGGRCRAGPSLLSLDRWGLRRLRQSKSGDRPTVLAPVTIGSSGLPMGLCETRWWWVRRPGSRRRSPRSHWPALKQQCGLSSRSRKPGCRR